MKQQCKISIIIPVYNVEKYINNCVDGVLGQSFTNYELILVDDGSTDSSLKLCREYENKDNRVKVISQKNGGAASARNTGIKKAIGEYILFIDSDDYIEKDSIQKIMEQVEKDGECDLAFIKAYSVFSESNIKLHANYDKNNYYNKTHEEVFSYLSEHDPLPVCVWGKLIKRELLVANNIVFQEGIICEDVDFCMSMYMHAKTYNYLDVDYYYYREDRPGSVMNINVDKKYYSLFYIISRWNGLAKKQYKHFEKYINNVMAYQYCMLLPMYKRLPKEKQKEEKKNIKSISWLLSCSKDIRVKGLNVICKILGIGMVANILYLYNKQK